MLNVRQLISLVINLIAVCGKCQNPSQILTKLQIIINYDYDFDSYDCKGRYKLVSIFLKELRKNPIKFDNQEFYFVLVKNIMLGNKKLFKEMLTLVRCVMESRLQVGKYAVRHALGIQNM